MTQFIGRFATVLFLVSICFQLALYGQTWNFNELGDDVRTTAQFSSGLFYYIPEGDIRTLTCRHVADGKVAWQRSFNEFEDNRAPLFLSPQGELIVGAEDSLYFFEADTGQELAVLPIYEDDWSDLRYEPSDLDPDNRWLQLPEPSEWLDQGDSEEVIEFYVDGRILILYYHAGFEVVDLVERRRIYAGKDKTATPRVVKNGDYTMIIFKGRKANSYILNHSTGEMIHQHSNRESKVLQEYFQQLYLYDNLAVFFTRDGAEVLDLETRSIKHRVQMETEDADAIFFVPGETTLFAVQSYDETQTVFDMVAGKALWQSTEQGLGRIAESVYLLQDGANAIWLLHDDDNNVYLARVEMTSGRIDWTTCLGMQEESFESYFDRRRPFMQEKLFETSFTRITSNLKKMVAKWRPFEVKYLEKMSDAVFLFAAETETSILGVLAGRIYQHCSEADVDFEEYDGESLITISLTDGRIEKREKLSIISHQFYDSYDIYGWSDGFDTREGRDHPFVTPNFEANLSLRETFFDSTLVVPSAHSLLFFRPDSSVDTLQFFAGQPETAGCRVRFINHEEKYLDVFLFEDNEDDDLARTEYWRVFVSPAGFKTQMLYRSGLRHYPQDSVLALNRTYVITKDSISAWPPITNYPADLSVDKRLWSVSFEELSKGAFGADQDDALDDYTPQFLFGGPDHLIIHGDDGLVVIGPDGQLHGSMDIEFEHPLDNYLPDFRIGDYLFRQDKKKTMLFNLVDASKHKLFEKKHRGPTYFFENERAVIFVDKSEETITCHILNE